MSWTRPADLAAQVRKLWERGAILASLVDAEPLFPLRLRLQGPSSRELVDHFDQVRAWVSELQAMRYCRIQTRQVQHRVRGSNAVPDQVWVDGLDDALAMIGRRREAALFEALVQDTRQRQPALLAWLRRRPLRAVDLATDWSRLLDVVAWLQANPRPGIYVRQVDIPGVHSKFIERHRGVLTELLDLALPANAIDGSAGGIAGFHRRYGFAGKPERIRFRLLDPALSLLPGSLLSGIPGSDITLDVDSFRALRCDAARVFITENETNFLAFPPVAGSLVLFGAGYGFSALAGDHWLQHRQLHYWGDIDTHGFAILDQLRSRFAHVRSFLMDRATLMALEPMWGEEAQPVAHDLPRLDAAERALYDDLRYQRIRPNLRLEQEFIGFDRVRHVLAALPDV